MLYALEYGAEKSVNRHQRITHSIRIVRELKEDCSDVVIALEDICKKYIRMDEKAKQKRPKCLICEKEEPYRRDCGCFAKVQTQTKYYRREKEEENKERRKKPKLIYKVVLLVTKN